MKKLIKKITPNCIDILGADEKYHSIEITYDDKESFASITREQILATGAALHLGLPISGFLNCIDDFINRLDFAVHCVKKYADEEMKDGQ